MSKKSLTFMTIAAILLLILTELLLQALCLVSERVDIALGGKKIVVAEALPDSILGYRPNPAHPQHDSKGFRNRKVIHKPDILALGDSQTYGIGIWPSQAWPKVLGKLTGKQVYSMAFGGYGSIHYVQLFEEAMSLEPRHLIVAFYSGNDLWDAFRHNQRSQPAVAVDTAQSKSTVKADEATKALGNAFRATFAGPNPNAPRHGSARAFVARHSKLYGLLRKMKQALDYFFDFRSSANWEKHKQRALKSEGLCQVYEGARGRTIFTSNYRMIALDLDDENVMNGYRLNLEAIKTLRDSTQARGLPFTLLLLPTKELAFQTQAAQSSWRPPEAYTRLVGMELRFWELFKRDLGKDSIAYVDALPVLQEALAAGETPYRSSADGHLNAEGNRMVARVVQRHLNSQKR